MYTLIVFTEVTAALETLQSGVARPLALIVRLGTGRLVEIDFGLLDEGGAITAEVRSLLPPSSSALIFRDHDLRTLDEGLGHWEHVVHSL